MIILGESPSRLACTNCVNHIYSGMDFEYDPSKDEANRFKHGLRLSFGLKIFDDPAHIILASHREIDGEERYKAIGLVGDKLYTACMSGGAARYG